MREILTAYLPIFVNILLCVLLVFLIIICVKILKALNKVEVIVEDVDKKVKSLDGMFGLIDAITDKLSTLTEVIADSIINFIKNIFKKKRKKNCEIQEEDCEDE